MKPILVVSLAGYQRIMDDLAFVGKLSDSPDLAKNLEGMITFFTQGQGLAGLDKTKPWGLAASTDGLSFQLARLHSGHGSEEAAGRPVWLPWRRGQGRRRLQAASPRSADSAVHQRAKGFAYISQDSAGFSNLPKDPVKLLSGLDKQYDVAIRLSVQNIPEVFRQLAIDQIKMGVEGSLEQARGKRRAIRAAPRSRRKQQMDTLVTTLNELDEVTIGLSIDEARTSARTLTCR